MNNKTPYILLISLAILLPAAVLLERSESAVWNNRLVIPFFEPIINLHTPINALGTFLPPVIHHDLTLTTKDNPVLIPNQTRVAKGVTLTIEAGTNIYAHEYADLTIDGNLQVNGKTDNPVTFNTNEMHPRNQTWGGLIFSSGSTGNLSHVIMKYGSPAISCLGTSNVAITNAKISLGNLGLYTENSTCSLSNSTIDNVLDGVISTNGKPILTNTTIQAERNSTKEIIR